MHFTNYLGLNSNSSLTDLEINRNEIIYKKLNGPDPGEPRPHQDGPAQIKSGARGGSAWSS
jgi:hypothetical protein